MTSRAYRIGAWGLAVAMAIVWALAWWPTRARTVAQVWVGDVPGEGRVWVEWPYGKKAGEPRVWTVGSLVPQAVPAGEAPRRVISLRVRPTRAPVEIGLDRDVDGSPVVGVRLGDGTSRVPERWRPVARIRERRAPAGWVWRGWGARLVPVVRWPEPLEPGPAGRVLTDRVRREASEYLVGTRRGIWTESFRRMFRRQPAWTRTLSREWQLLDVGQDVIGVLRRDLLAEAGTGGASWRGYLATGAGVWVGGRDLFRLFRDDVDWKSRLGPGFSAQLSAQGVSGARGIEQRLTTIVWADNGLVLVAAQPGGTGDRLVSAWWPAADLSGVLSGLVPTGED